MKSHYLKSFLENTPTSWAIIRACEAELLSRVKFRKPILEIGCGDGLFSQILFKDRMMIDAAIDIDNQEIERARKTKIYKQLYVMDVRSMNFKNASFNNVFSNGVLEHITNLPIALSEINRILSAKGELIITCPTNYLTTNLFIYNLLISLKLRYPAEIYGKLFNKVFRHHNLYSRKKWEDLLDSTGFQLVKYKVYGTRKSIWIHELLLPFALFSIVSKKYFHNQVFLKTFRKRVIKTFWLPILVNIPCFNPEKQYNSSTLIIAKKI